MKYLSVCSGIEAATVAWEPLGWTPLAFSEIEAFPSALLAEKYPSVPNLGDMTKFQEWPDLEPDILVGGTPCQSFSVAGLRKGLADPRGNLTLTYLAIAARYRPAWLVWENVPGVLSDKTGAFASLLGGLAELGYGWAYRVLDAQYVRVESHPRAVPQRRRRVFVVGHSDWRRAAAVLFERESLCGHPAPRRETGQIPAVVPGCGFEGGGTLGPRVSKLSTDACSTGAAIVAAIQGTAGRGVPIVPEIAWALQERDAKGADSSTKPGHLIPVGGGFDEPIAFHNRPDPDVSGSVTHPLGAQDNGMGILIGDPYASTQEADSTSVLSTLRDRVGAEAVAQWGSRILDSLQSPEVLRAWLHGEGLRRAASDFQSFVDDCPLPREEGEAPRSMRVVWENGPDGRTPQGRGLAKQLAYELGEALPKLPHQEAFGEETLRRLRKGAEGARLLQQALSEIQEVRRPDGGKAQSAHGAMQVRRLTPREVERLQGFPDDYTLIQVRGKPAADGPRYRALGNSMAVNVMRWIGDRIKGVA